MSRTMTPEFWRTNPEIPMKFRLVPENDILQLVTRGIVANN
jgi:hypothetical protein